MNLNAKKSKIMKITKKTQPLNSSFFLENSGLEEDKKFKDLLLINTYHGTHTDVVSECLD